jgi:predicted metal-dependent phosphoesterase TrpH
MLIELHCHTDASKDSLMQPAAMIRVCRQRGIGKLAITDHNTIAGARALQALAPELVIVGEEIMTTQGELLAYFVKEEVPRGLTPTETIARLRAQGAVIGVAHPFDRLRSGAWREADLAALVPLVDAIEVFNARCIFAADYARALAFAQEHGKPGLVGSDAHSYMELGLAALKADLDSTEASLLAALATGERVTHLSSPVIHLTSTYARYSKWLRRLAGPG